MSRRRSSRWSRRTLRGRYGLAISFNRRAVCKYFVSCRIGVSCNWNYWQNCRKNRARSRRTINVCDCGSSFISVGGYLHANSDRAKQQLSNDQNSSKGQDLQRSSAQKKVANHALEEASEGRTHSKEQKLKRISAPMNPNDSVELLSAMPQPGTNLERGRPLRFDIRLAYNFVSADAAILSVSTAQFRSRCNGTQGELVDAVEVPIQNGRHII